MPQVEVRSETEAPRGWVYRVAVGAPTDRPDARREHEVHLAWVDHEHWSGGRVPPSRVALAVVETLLASGPVDKIPARFDAATVRRWVPDADAQIRRRLDGTPDPDA